MIVPWRVLVTGSRSYSTPDPLRASMDAAVAGHRDVVVVHGRCNPRRAWGDREVVPWNRAMLLSPGEQRLLLGADWHAHLYAEERGWLEDPHPADWHTHGRKAGFVRNAGMVAAGADRCVAAPEPGLECKGTRMCADLAEKAGIPVTWVNGTGVIDTTNAGV